MLGWGKSDAKGAVFRLQQPPESGQSSQPSIFCILVLVSNPFSHSTGVKPWNTMCQHRGVWGFVFLMFRGVHVHVYVCL